MGVTSATGVVATSLPTLHPGVRTGTIYYTSQAIINSATTAAAAANALYYQPISLVGSVNRIGIEVTTGAAGACRLGIYSNLLGLPDALILDAGTVDTTNIAIVEATITALPLDGKWVWLAAIFDAAPTCRTGSAASPSILGASTPSSTARGLVVARTYGALPAAAPAPTGFSSAGPAVFLRST
jgi:hypothetical protein